MSNLSIWPDCFAGQSIYLKKGDNKKEHLVQFGALY